MLVSIIPAVALVAVGLVVVTGLLRPSDRQVGAFARVYGVTLSERNTPMIRTQIARMRRWRFGGAVAGYAAAAIWAIATAGSLSGNQTVGAIAAGFAAGVLLAELTRRSAPTTGRAAAAAAPRRPEQYIAPWLLVALGSVALLVAMYLTHAALYRIGAPIPLTDTGIPPVRRSRLLAAVAAWIALSGGTVVALRRLAQAPESAPFPDVFEANRAIRSSAMVTVLGAFWMGMSALGARVAWPVVASDSGAWQWPNNVAYLVMSLGTMGGFLTCLNALPRTGGYFRVPQVPRVEERQA